VALVIVVLALAGVHGEPGEQRGDGHRLTTLAITIAGDFGIDPLTVRDRRDHYAQGGACTRIALTMHGRGSLA
jgi:hypothetical protein